jgi:LCP family protein required for cell wall assembly
MASKRRRRRKAPNSSDRLLKALLAVLLVLVLIAGGLFLFIQSKLGLINRLPADSSLADYAEGMDWDEAGVATSVDGVVNVLLVGQDTRSGERERSDSMILFSVNKNTNQMTMVSLMRDLYVEIPDHGMMKLNAAYALGGFDLLDATIAQNLGVAIDYNVEVDFTGFQDIIDTLGGIDIELYQEEADYINDKLKQDTLTEGMNHLDGKEALWYARTRKVGNSDFERTQRQRVVLSTIYSELKDAGWIKLLQVYDSVADNITTDMTNSQILGIGFSVYTMGKDNLNSYRIPADGMYASEYHGAGMDVLVPTDWDETRALLYEYLYSENTGAADPPDTEGE